jgi:hypothetical protein
MKQQQREISNLCRKIDGELIIHDVETHNYNNDIIEKLHISQQQIDKFLTEDSHRYVPTGLFFIYYFILLYRKISEYVRIIHITIIDISLFKYNIFIFFK